jgi:hypothetical protein
MRGYTDRRATTKEIFRAYLHLTDENPVYRATEPFIEPS